MSRMVKARTPDSRTCGFSIGSTSRSPTITAFCGATFGLVAEQVRELGRPAPDDAGQRHAVDVAAGTGFRRVHVGVRVEPDQADGLLALRK